MKNREFRAPIVGGTSLITIFAVLCLIVFTLLTMSTVLASRNLAERSHEAVRAYYAADSQAETIFAQLRGGEIPSNVVKNGEIYTYDCPISDTQYIHVVLSFADGRWNVIEWRAITELL